MVTWKGVKKSMYSLKFVYTMKVKLQLEHLVDDLFYWRSLRTWTWIWMVHVIGAVCRLDHEYGSCRFYIQVKLKEEALKVKLKTTLKKEKK